jgi:hypothetical protein
MGRLATMAKAAKGLKGPVQVTFRDGTSRTFKDEVEAEAACKGLALEHKRGAFFEAEGALPPHEDKPRRGKDKGKSEEGA